MITIKSVSNVAADTSKHTLFPKEIDSNFHHQMSIYITSNTITRIQLLFFFFCKIELLSEMAFVTEIT